MSIASINPFSNDTAHDLPYVTNRRHEPIIMDITPKLAAEWLQRVPETQRSMRDSAIERYVKDMRGGSWVTDYSPYRFDKQGYLIDGQHRCQAIIEANVILPDQAVVFGMESGDYGALDQGVKRTFGDNLKFHGFTNSLLLSALAYRLDSWNKGKSFRKHNDRPTQDELLRLVRENNEEMQAALKIGKKVSDHVRPFINSVASLGYFLCRRIDWSDAEYFYGRLIDGQGLMDGDPIYALRNRWAVNAARQRDDVPDYVQGAMLIKAWNFYRSGDHVNLLVWKSGGKKPEPFPQPK